MDFFPPVDTRWRAEKVIRWGYLSAIVMAIWSGLQILMILVPAGFRILSEQSLTAIILTIFALFATFTAWKLQKQSGFYAAMALIGVLILDLVVRVVVTVISGSPNISVLYIVVLLIVLRGLVNAIRGLRALKVLPFDDEELARTFG